MTQRTLRHKPSGVIFAYQEAFATRPDFEEIIDVEAREIPEAPAPKKRVAAKAEDKPVTTEAV